MRLRSVFLTLASIAVAVLLIALLVSIAHIDLYATLRQLESANRTAFLWLTLLMAMNTYLSAQKWQLMDRVIRRPGDAVPSRIVFFAVTSAGVALGQLLPMQVSMLVARVLGTQFHGRALTRGTVGTLFDQGSDFFLVCFLIPASVITRVFSGSPVTWVGAATGMVVVALLTADRAVALLRSIAVRLGGRNVAHPGRVRRGFAELGQSGLLEASLVRKLLGLSVLRFLILVLMAGQTSHAIGSSVRLLHLAGAMPFVVVSSALAITPGGIGVNELTYTTALTLFGTPLPVAGQWALANRVLVAAAAFVVAGCSAGILLTVKSRERLRRNQPVNAFSPR